MRFVSKTVTSPKHNVQKNQARTISKQNYIKRMALFTALLLLNCDVSQTQNLQSGFPLRSISRKTPLTFAAGAVT